MPQRGLFRVLANKSIWTAPEWLAKITEPGARRRAEFYNVQIFRMQCRLP
jgi:hypothetical protein